MQLLELALQGVRGFAPSVRVQLKTGYWVLQPSVQGTPPLGALLSALLFSDGRGGDAAFAVPGAKEASAGVMLQGNDHSTYWLVRNLGQSGALHRYVPTTQSFDPVSAEATEIAQFVRGQLGAPPKAALEGLFTFSLAQLPTNRPRTKGAAPAAAAAPAKPALASARPVEAAQDVAGARQKIAELEKELALAEEVGKIQYQVDGIASRVFGLEEKLKQMEGLRAQVEEAEATAQAAPTPESLKLPPDILARVERYPTLLQKRDDALAKLESDREGTGGSTYTGETLWSDARFWGSVAAGLAFLIGGAFASGLARYVALLDIPAFGVGAILALRHLDERERSERGSRRGSRLADREQKIIDQFEAEAGAVKSAMQTLNVDTPAGITELLSQRPALQARAQEVRARLEQTLASPEVQEAQRELGTLKAQQSSLDEQLSEKGAYVRDGREIEREIGRLKESIALADAPKPAPAPVATPTAAPTAETLPDPGPPLLSLAADLLATDLPSTAGLIKERAVQYASAFTDRRVTGLETDTQGKMSALTAAGKVPLGALAGPDLNLVYLALRFSVLERYSMKFRVPVVVEDVATGMEPAQVSLIARVLKGLGKLTQVLHVTERPEFVEAADGHVAV